VASWMLQNASLRLKSNVFPAACAAITATLGLVRPRETMGESPAKGSAPITPPFEGFYAFHPLRNGVKE